MAQTISSFGKALHMAIGGAAQDMLPAGSQAKLTVADLLSKGKHHDLGQAAFWADQIKSGAGNFNDAHTKAFLKDPKNKSHANWHFVNLPLGASHYDPEELPTFTNDTDVVQMTAETIRVLQGKSQRFSSVNGLRLLAHFMGDLHQPLHVACAYVDFSATPPKFEQDPDVIVARNLPSDRGGNNVSLPNNQKLHQIFDDGVGADRNPDTISVAMPPGDPATWPATWASETIARAREVYDKLTPVGLSVDGKRVQVDWGDEAEFRQSMKTMMDNQVNLAANRFSKLLLAIFPG